MLHPHCKDGRRLLDDYLIALTRAQSRTESASDHLLKAKEDLTDARNRYWRHVGFHGCRARSEGGQSEQ